MKILLINLPYYRLMGLRHRYFPIGLGYIAAVLRKAGYDVRIYDMEKHKREGYLKSAIFVRNRVKHHALYIKALHNNNHPIWKELRNVFLDYSPDIVGISIGTVVYPVALKVAQFIKQLKKEVIIVAGGIHPTVCDEEVANQGVFDFVVRGEGEETFLDLVQYIHRQEKKFETIQGITYRKNGGICRTPDRPLMNTMNGLPFPARDSVINSSLLTERELGCLTMSRGCPYSCSFCSAREIWGNTTRIRTPEDVFSEIQKLYRKQNVTFFTFFDDTFTVYRQDVIRLCDLIIREQMPINWFAHGRIDSMDKELVYKIKQGRCYAMQFGIESGSQGILNNIRKGFVLEDAYNIRKMFRKLGMIFWTSFIIGLPGETEQDLKQTYDCIRKLEPDIVNINAYIPYPGSKDWKTYVNNTGEKIKWEDFSPQNHFAKFTSINNDSWMQWRYSIEKLADRLNMRTKYSMRWGLKLYIPKLLRLLQGR